jgi:hypothetical protein
MADFKILCPSCGQHISCDSSCAGARINCPTCNQAIVVPPLAAGGGIPPTKSNGRFKILLIAAVALIVAAGGFFGVTFALKHFSGSKSRGNPAAQVPAPTAEAAVQALSILTKVHSAYTNLVSAKADGTFTMYLNLSNITVADVSPGAAKTKNANRHPAGMPRIITNSTELTVKRSGTNFYYIAGDAVSKVDRRNFTNTFAFWKTAQGQFTFSDGAAPVYRKLPDLNPANNQAEQLKKIQKFFEDPANLTKIVKNLGQTADEPVEGQDCYTLTAKVLGQKVKIWVDKSTYLISQWQVTLGGELSDADIDDAFSLFAGVFTNLPPSGLNGIKAEVKKRAPLLAKIRGTLTSASRNFEINPALSPDDFNYPVPPGVRMVEMPAVGNSRPVSQRNACINNLRQIDAAKQQWALEKGKKASDVPTEDDLKPYLSRGADEFPKCPLGGKYTIGELDQPPTCSVPGHTL